MRDGARKHRVPPYVTIPAAQNIFSPRAAGNRTWEGAAFEIDEPPRQTMPVVLASPHSGNVYTPGFLAQSQLDMRTLRRSEDAHVDVLYGAAAALGVPLLRALFPRCYVDPNREPYELDPTMYSEPLPHHAHTQSPRVAAGLGTLAKVISAGQEIYRQPLTLADMEHRLASCYRPYHEALETLVRRTQRRFGVSLLVDAHSMPSGAAAVRRGRQTVQADMVLGDCHGRACSGGLTALAKTSLESLGYVVAVNTPYAGGFVTQLHGRPAEGRNCLQIEVNRALYMDEITLERHAGMATLGHDLARVVQTLGTELSSALAAE